jgi:hypothetical protein
VLHLFSWLIATTALSLPRGLLKQAKRMAADEVASVSALMARALARLVDDRMRFSGAAAVTGSEIL